MSRKRYISTDISTDSKVDDLASRSLLAALVYTWAVPHMDDWGRITGETKEFKMQVCPGIDVSVKDIDEAIQHVMDVGLWIRYEVDGKRCLSVSKPDSWFKHQSYINKAKRDDDSGSSFPSLDKRRKTPQNAEEQQETPKSGEEQQRVPQNAVSFSSSFSVSPSLSNNSSSGIGGKNPFALFEKHEFGKLNEITAQFIEDCINTYTEDWVKRAMVESVKHGIKTWAYVEGILKRWKATGHNQPWTLEKEEPPKQQTRNFGRPQSPKLPMAKDDGTAPPITPEEREKMLELARKLKGESA